jgi:hypothetical protein
MIPPISSRWITPLAALGLRYASAPPPTSDLLQVWNERQVQSWTREAPPEVPLTHPKPYKYYSNFCLRLIQVEGGKPVVEASGPSGEAVEWIDVPGWIEARPAPGGMVRDLAPFPRQRRTNRRPCRTSTRGA